MTLDDVKAEILKMRKEGESYKNIGDSYGVNKGIIYLILNNDYEPKNKRLRKKLGLEGFRVNFIKQIRTSKGTFADAKVLENSNELP
jgi:hypothetical protein